MLIDHRCTRLWEPGRAHWKVPFFAPAGFKDAFYCSVLSPLPPGGPEGGSGLVITSEAGVLGRIRRVILICICISTLSTVGSLRVCSDCVHSSSFKSTCGRPARRPPNKFTKPSSARGHFGGGLLVWQPPLAEAAAVLNFQGPEKHKHKGIFAVFVCRRFPAAEPASTTDFRWVRAGFVDDPGSEENPLRCHSFLRLFGALEVSPLEARSVR